MKPVLLLLGMPVVVFGLTGCTVGPDYHTPRTSTPEKWTAPLEGGVNVRTGELSRWWTVFGDPALDSLIALASRANHDLRMAEARIRLARAQRDFSQADFWPVLDASGSYANQRISRNQPILNVVPNQVLSIMGIPFENNVFQGGFDATWEIDLFGGRRRALEGADADLAACVEARQDVLVSLLAEVARNYITLRALQERLTIAEDNIHRQQEACELTRQRFQAGLTSELDVSQAAALLADTKTQVPALETQLRQAMYRLAILSAQPPGALVEILSATAPVPPTPPDVPVGLPADLLRRRPDIRRAERKLAAETARIGVQVAELFPKFALNGNIGLESANIGTLFLYNSLLWSVGPSLRWRIFDAGRVRAGIQAQTARQEEALAAYEKAVLTALEDVEIALVAYANEKVRYRAVEEEVAQDQHSLDLARELYRQGRVYYLNVLEAHRALYQAQDKLAQSRQAISQNLVMLYKALGGGWEEAAPATATSRPCSTQISEPVPVASMPARDLIGPAGGATP